MDMVINHRCFGAPKVLLMGPDAARGGCHPRAMGDGGPTTDGLLPP